MLKIPHYQSAATFAKKKSANEINVQIASILICEWNLHCVRVQYLHGCTFHALWRCLYLSGLFSIFLWWLRADHLFWNLDRHISLLKTLTCNSSLCSFNGTFWNVVSSFRYMAFTLKTWQLFKYDSLVIQVILSWYNNMSIASVSVRLYVTVHWAKCLSPYVHMSQWQWAYH